ncbi:MAG: hypothetical protein ACR2JU_10625 [Nocardioidaceae bacterium]
MNASKRKGTSWESAIVGYLRERGWPYAERRALSGNRDRGDVAGIAGVVIEAKAAKALDLAGWTAEAEAERVNDGAHLAAVWVKRRGKGSPADGYVLLDGRTFVSLLKAGGYQ